MDGKVFDMKDFAPGSTAPPFHNRCRTATAPYFDDEFDDMGERAARDEDGNYYTVPSNMKYDDWYKAFVEKDEGILEKFGKTIYNVGVIKEVIDLSSLKDFDEMSVYCKDKYNIEIDNSVFELDFKNCKDAFSGIESMFDDFPELKDKFVKMTTSKSGVMSCSLDGHITFNPFNFAKDYDLDKLFKEQVDLGFWVKNATPSATGVHETAHMVESLLIDLNKTYEYDFQKIHAWDNCNEAKTIVSQACKNIKKTDWGKGKKNGELIGSISRYAQTDASETMAEAFADVYANGENASPLSLEIKRLTLDKYKKYKGVEET